MPRLTVIEAGRLVDGTGAEPIEAARIVVEGQRIREVGPASQVKVPGGDVDRIDFSEYTVIPGLLDGHVHLNFSALPTALPDILAEDNPRILLRAVHNAQLALRVGVTTVRDCGGRDLMPLRLRDAIAAGVIPGPRILAAGPAITVTGGHCYFFNGEVDSADGMRQLARQLAKDGVDFFKVMSTGGRMTPNTNVTAAQFTVEELTALVQEAKRLNRKTTAHGHGTAGIRNAVAAGIDCIEHCTWVSEEDDTVVDYDPKVAEQMVKQGTYLSPTISPARVNNADPGADPHLSEVRRRVQGMRPKIREAQRDMLAKGVKIIGSTDAGVANVPLDSMPGELEAAVEELGLTPMQAITAATYTGSQAFVRSGVFGSLQAGRRADFLVVDGDPSTTISDIRKLRWVFKDGVAEVENGRLIRC
jgi:imidazolonepropionase-like amidohydrolase